MVCITNRKLQKRVKSNRLPRKKNHQRKSLDIPVLLSRVHGIPKCAQDHWQKEGSNVLIRGPRWILKRDSGPDRMQTTCLCKLRQKIYKKLIAFITIIWTSSVGRIKELDCCTLPISAQRYTAAKWCNKGVG